MKYIRCPFCGAVNEDVPKCRRCDQTIFLQRKASLQKALALLIAAIAFYIPANIYPILQTSKFSNTYGSTIIEGVIQMFQAGDYPVALIILVASVIIPLTKFIVLFYIIYALWKADCKSVRQKIFLYHLIEITGPWSLIDVFVVIILVALIHFKNIAIIPGVGATSFAIMVVLTILSASSIDERLIGEECEKR
ncbi:paraquat-inducible protein A [Nitratiruptor tergarcus]|uniref:Paraquat-inducible protein A n=1 Tax=Nitratiruptor tergarcus DSM 16512 TaxID=1069081 RepID=A0A1W1WS61_9BACT|nr:paraquat-inducible protein A [Nitratiruptor tergarcus]SMC09045.1 paraquat-inducible protein A [Nitratiruptor tergarcus DSM 16512]